MIKMSPVDLPTQMESPTPATEFTIGWRFLGIGEPEEGGLARAGRVWDFLAIVGRLGGRGGERAGCCGSLTETHLSGMGGGGLFSLSARALALEDDSSNHLSNSPEEIFSHDESSEETENLLDMGIACTCTELLEIYLETTILCGLI